MATVERRSRRMETLPAKLGSHETAEAGRGLAQQLKSLATPSRPGDKGFLDGLEAPSPMGPMRSSYREMLRASGQQALLRVQHGEPHGAQRCTASPCPPGKLSGGEPSPNLPLPSLLLSSHLTAMGDSSVRSTTSAPCLPSNAFALPPASVAPSPVHLATSPVGTPMISGFPDMPTDAGSRTPMISGFPDMSPDAGSRSCKAYWPDRSPTFCMERQPSDLLAFAMQPPPPMQPLPQAAPQAAPTPAQTAPQGAGGADLMAIAMPHATRMSWDGEQIAAQLRAAAPEVYED